MARRKAPRTPASVASSCMFGGCLGALRARSISKKGALPLSLWIHGEGVHLHQRSATLARSLRESSGSGGDESEPGGEHCTLLLRLLCGPLRGLFREIFGEHLHRGQD